MKISDDLYPQTVISCTKINHYTPLVTFWMMTHPEYQIHPLSYSIPYWIPQKLTLILFLVDVILGPGPYILI